jgi:hypothetical protein
MYVWPSLLSVSAGFSLMPESGYPEAPWNSYGPPSDTLGDASKMHNEAAISVIMAWTVILRESLTVDYSLTTKPTTNPNSKSQSNLALFTRHLVEMARRCRQGHLPDAKHWMYLGQQIRWFVINSSVSASDVAVSDIAIHVYYHWLYHAGGVDGISQPRSVLNELADEARRGNPDRLIRKHSVDLSFFSLVHGVRADRKLKLGNAFLSDEHYRVIFETAETLAAQHGVRLRAWGVRNAPGLLGALGGMG